MSIPDKIAAANKINDLLKGIVANGGLRLKYRITVDPPLAEQRDWERPEIRWNSWARTRRCSWSEAENYYVRLNSLPSKCSACPAMSTRKSVSTA